MSTIRMIKDNPRPGTPGTADIHPDEVANMRAYGWRVVETEEAATAEPAKKKPGRPPKSA